MIKLYQIRLSREDIRRAEAGERDLPIFGARLDAILSGQFPGREWYTHVADIFVDDLEGAFEIGNIGPAEKILSHAPRHSVSIGDVLVGDYGAYIVKDLGFDRIDGWTP